MKTLDVFRRDFRLIQHKLDAVEHAQFRRLGGGQDLAAEAFFAGFQHDIGESAANIGGEFDVAHGVDYHRVFQICKELSLLKDRATWEMIDL